ncbi:MAG: hypothetical protein FWC48_04640 [Actinomycetia bacterium]|nr:hypothetical protein [Actinomycetes bacterium]
MKTSTLTQAVLKLGRGQRRAALALTVGLVVLLAATIVAVVLVNTGRLRPTPTNRLQSDYLRAQDRESAALRAAKSAGRPAATDPAVISARADLVLIEIQAGQKSAALSRARGLSRAAPSSAQARSAYAAALVASGDTQAALPQFATALRLLKSGDPELQRSILISYADALVSDRQPEKAYAQLRQAAAIVPASADLYVRAAVLATRSQDFKNAAADYLSALTYDPGNSAAKSGLATLERDHPAAVAAARKEAL